jgi:hypothetical protein
MGVMSGEVSVTVKSERRNKGRKMKDNKHEIGDKHYRTGLHLARP